MIVGRSNWVLLKVAAAMIALLLVSACATSPFNSSEVTTELSPSEILENPDQANGTVIWGGVILGTTNHENRTQIEVLAYPLNNFQKPVTTKESLGRFLLQSPDYIETVDYAPGRKITAIGTLQGVTEGEIGVAQLVYPTVTLNNLHLWKTDINHERPRFIFGIGINISN